MANNRGILISDAPNPGQTSTKLLAEQRRRWLGGERVPVEELSRANATSNVDHETILDLIYQEVLLREEHGELPEIDEYVKRFPQLADELRIQFELDGAMQALQQFPMAPDGGQVIGNSLSTMDQDDEILPPRRSSHGDGTHLPEVEGYEVLHWIGQGGMAVVFKARHQKLNRPVALKMLRDHYGATANHVRRFLTEAQAAARLQHPHIVQIYEVGQHQGRPFLAYEYLDGGTLGELTNGQPIEPRLAAKLVETLARTLCFAHQHGVIHRDLKPGNILLQRITESGVGALANPVIDRMADLQAASGIFSGFQLKIADFGLAKVFLEKGDLASHSDTKTGDILGTPAYMSPEQARGDIANLTTATDTYALGAILYELLTGRPPFVGIQPLEVLNQVIADEPVQPSQLVRGVPKDLQTICLKCLDKSPGLRYASAADLADDLHRFLTDQPIMARRTSAWERGCRWCRRHPAKSILAASLASTLIFVAVVSTVYSILLGQQLSLTSRAKSDEQTAKLQAVHQLWAAHLSYAESLRTSGQIGQRFDGLHAIDAARALGQSIQFSPEQTDRMRNATIACLAQSDTRVVCAWRQDWNNFLSLSIDDQQRVYAVHTRDNSIVVFRTGDGSEVSRISDVSGDCVARLSPDGKKLAVLDDTCRVFRIDTTAPELIYESARLGDWGFAPDSTQIVGVDGGGKLTVIDLQSGNGKVIRSLGPFAALQEIVVSPDARRAVLLVGDEFQVIELDSGKVIFQGDAPGGPTESQRFAWHPDSRNLAIGQYPGEGIVLWDLESGTKHKSFYRPNGSLTFLFNSTGDLLLMFDNWGGQMQLWNVGSGEVELSKFDIQVAGLSRDQKGGFFGLQLQGDNHIGLLAIEHSMIYRTLPLFPTPSPIASTLHLSYSPDGLILAVAIAGEVQLINAESLVPLDHLAMGSSCIRFDRDESLLTLNSLGLRRWRPTKTNVVQLAENAPEIRSGTFGPPVQVGNGHTAAVFDISRDGKHIAIPTGDGALICSTDDLNPPIRIGPHRDVRSLSFSADGRSLATGGWESGQACIWDVDSGRLLHTIDQPSCCTVEFSPDGKWLVTNSADLTVWHTDTWTMAWQPDVPGQSVIGVRTCFTPDSRMLAVSDSTARIHLFNPADGSEFATLTDPNQHIVSRLTFSPNGNQLAVASDANGGVFHVWDLAAIREELHTRNLDLPSETPPASPFARDSRKIDAIKFVADEKFTQLEAAQQVLRATAAAEKHDISSARAAIARATQLQPKDALSCNNLAWLLATGPLPLRDASTAVTLARRANQDESLTSAESSLYLNTLGVALYRAGQIEEAVETLNRSLVIQSPESQPFDLFFLSMCHARLGDKNSARDFFNKAEVLVNQHRKQMPKNWMNELKEFAEESKPLLDIFKMKPESHEAPDPDSAL